MGQLGRRQHHWRANRTADALTRQVGYFHQDADHQAAAVLDADRLGSRWLLVGIDCVELDVAHFAVGDVAVARLHSHGADAAHRVGFGLAVAFLLGIVHEFPLGVTTANSTL